MAAARVNVNGFSMPRFYPDGRMAEKHLCWGRPTSAHGRPGFISGRPFYSLPGRSNDLTRTYPRLRDLAGPPKHLVLYLARHECGTKICREEGIEYARRLLGLQIS